MLLAGLVSQKKERAVVGDPGTKLQHNSMYAGRCGLGDNIIAIVRPCCSNSLSREDNFFINSNVKIWSNRRRGKRNEKGFWKRAVLRSVN